MEKTTTKGYFKSKRKDNDGFYQNIKCNGKECELIDFNKLNNKCYSPGELIKSNSNTYFCKDETENFDFEYRNEKTEIIVIENTNNNIFGSGETSDYLILISKNNSIIPINLTTCMYNN